jgi:hypothetical protein
LFLNSLGVVHFSVFYLGVHDLFVPMVNIPVLGLKLFVFLVLWPVIVVVISFTYNVCNISFFLKSVLHRWSSSTVRCKHHYTASGLLLSLFLNIDCISNLLLLWYVSLLLFLVMFANISRSISNSIYFERLILFPYPFCGLR